MDEKNHTNPGKNWKAADFERYYKNSMAPGERHALEKDALDDPFLQEALDGYAFTHTPVDDVKNIKARLNPKETRAPVTWYKQIKTHLVWKAAALFIVFAGLAWIYFANRVDKGGAELASVQSNTIENNSYDSGQDNVDAQPSLRTDFDSGAPATSVVSKNAATQAPAVPNDEKETARVEKPVDEIKEELNSSPPERVALAKTKDVEDSVDVVQIGTATARKVSTTAEVEEAGVAEGSGTMTVIKGRVMDTEGSPVPYARINRPGANQSLSSDRDGYFSLSNPGQTLSVKVNALGYETTNAILSPKNPENKIVLKETENLALKNIKIAAKASKSKRETSKVPVQLTIADRNAPAPRVQLANAVPKDGWVRYNQKINDLTKQQPAPDSSGNVSLSFNIDNSGKAVNIKVVRRLTSATDSAAIFILQNAPPLKVINKTTPTSAVISFKK